jgi:tetratricopeptide (TPR) repeat protein
MKSHQAARVISTFRAIVPVLSICCATFGSSSAEEPKAAQPFLSPDVPKLTAQQRQKLREHDRLRSETWSLRIAANLDGALAAAEKMVAINREVFGNSHPLVAQALTAVAELQMRRNNFAGAQRVSEEVLRIQQSWGGADHWRVKDALRMLDRIKRTTGLNPKQLARLDDLDSQLRVLIAHRRFDQAGQLLEEYLATQKEFLGEQQQELNTFALLAGVRQGRSLLESEKLWRQFLEVCKATRGEQHPEYAKGLTQLGTMLIEKGRRDEAKKSFDRAARIYLMTLRAYDLDFAPWVLHLARMHAALLRQADRAESLLRLSAEIYEACRLSDGPGRGRAWRGRARVPARLSSSRNAGARSHAMERGRRGHVAPHGRVLRQSLEVADAQARSASTSAARHPAESRPRQSPQRGIEKDLAGQDA